MSFSTAACVCLFTSTGVASSACSCSTKSSTVAPLPLATYSRSCVSGFRYHAQVICAANNMTTASGSNTTTIKIMTQVTARSSILASGLSPYTNAAMYLIGPTSASTLRTSAAIGARASLSCEIDCCDCDISA